MIRVSHGLETCVVEVVLFVVCSAFLSLGVLFCFPIGVLIENS